MKILVLANRDLASNYALNLLLPALQEHELTLLLSSAVGGAASRPEPLKQLKFFEQQLFNDLLFPLLDHGRAGAFHSFAGLQPLLAHAPRVENAINSEDSLDWLRREQPDLILSIRYGGILREQVIAIPAHGVINLHSGLLPRYRGVMASFWAMLAGDRELGTTLHTIDDSSIDTGRMIATTSTALEADRSYLWNVLNLYPAGVQCMLDAVARLASANALVTTPQGEGGSYFTFPTEPQLQAFFAAGHRLFDPQEIITLVRRHYFGSTEEQI